MSAPDNTPPARILVVDDEDGVRRFVCTILRTAGYSPDEAEDAHVAQDRLKEQEYDVILSDITMPGLTGIDLLKIVQDETPDVPVILMTGNPSMDTAAEAIRAAAAVDYLSKPFPVQDLLRTVARAVDIKRVRDENRRLTEENLRYQQHLEEMVEEKSAELVTAYGQIRESYDFTLEAMVAMLDAREKTTGQHSLRVRNFSLTLAEELGVDEDQLNDIAHGTLLHDIGKIGIPDSVLLKPGKLTDEEWTIMRSHVQIGYELVKSSDYLAAAARIILEHHEKFDGSGYPNGLKGEEICLGARIFAVVDAYDAMRSVRVYKDAVPEEDALAEIRRCSGTHFDPDIVDVFLKCRPSLEEPAGRESQKSIQE